MCLMWPLSHIPIEELQQFIAVCKIRTSKYFSYMGREVKLFHPHLVIYKPIYQYQQPLMCSTYIRERLRKKHTFNNIRKYFAWSTQLFIRDPDDFFLGTHDFLPMTIYPQPFTHNPRHFTHNILPTTVS
jgi:hypothetical protein